jgi:hypothetical protein
MPVLLTNIAPIRARWAFVLATAFSFSLSSWAEQLRADGVMGPDPYLAADEADDGPALARATDDEDLLDDRPTITIDGKSCATTPRRGGGHTNVCPPHPCAPSESTEGATEPGGEPMTEQFARTGGGTTPVFDPAAAAGPGAGGTGGFLDPAFVVNQFRMRYDDGYDVNAPDRAEYFYAKSGALGNGAHGPTNRGFGAGTLGANYVNYQAVRSYLEVRLAPRLSVFAEVPVQFDNIHFASAFQTNSNSTFSQRTLVSSPNLNTGGLGDMNAGFKFAFLARRDRYLTFQLRTYAPTGNARLGLGTHHASLEPALLYWQALSSRAFIQGQLNDWIPIGGSDFQGNVLSYGGAFGYVVYRQWDPAVRGPGVSRYYLPGIVAPPNLFQVAPVAEVIGWNVLSGKEFLQGSQVRSAVGTSIVNLNLGVRVTKGANSLYGGWGHGMTSDIWYRNIFRLEYRRFF